MPFSSMIHPNGCDVQSIQHAHDLDHPKRSALQVRGVDHLDRQIPIHDVHKLGDQLE